jgi:GTP-binding protein
VLTASAKTGRHVARLLTEAIVLGDRVSGRIPTPELNRFLAEAVQARQPPVGTRRGGSGHRLRLIYMAQIAQRPPRFAIQVNSRTRVTRDYAYFIENRMRARYGMEGVPLIIDFVERGQRSGSESRGRRPGSNGAKRAASSGKTAAGSGKAAASSGKAAASSGKAAAGGSKPKPAGAKATASRAKRAANPGKRASGGPKRASASER